MLVIGFIIICSFNFYDFIALGNTVKLFQLAAIGLILALFFVYTIYDSSDRIKKNFTHYIWAILLSIPGSMMIAA